MKMKKLTGIVAMTTLMCSLVACGGAKENTVHSVDDLPGKTIGVQLGTTGDIYATDYEEEGSTIERYNKGVDAVQALKVGKIDCVIIDEEPAKAFISKNDDIQILDDIFADEEYAACFKIGNDELTKKFNDALKTLKENGTIDSIVSNYIGDNTKGKTPYETPAGTDHSKGKLVMATNPQFEPYEYYKDNKIVGIDADIAQAICDILGYELQIDDMEFDSIITAVDAGKADFGMAGMTVTEDRKKNVNFSDTYATARQVIITRK